MNSETRKIVARFIEAQGQESIKDGIVDKLPDFPIDELRSARKHLVQISRASTSLLTHIDRELKRRSKAKKIRPSI